MDCTLKERLPVPVSIAGNTAITGKNEYEKLIKMKLA
jgi:hypothetical protein